MHDYNKQATDLLEKFGVKFEYTNLGSEVSRVDPKRKNYRYIARFIRPGKQVEFDFHGSIADYEAHQNAGKDKQGFYCIRQAKKDKERAILHAYSVLSCLTKYNPGMFSDFCLDYDYDEDSRKAFKVYTAVCEEWKKVSSFFSASEIEEMKEIQ